MMAKFSKLITQLILIFLTATGLVQADQQTRYISSSNIQSSIETAYIEFKFARTIKVTHDKLKNPDRVYFDFTSSHIDKNLIDAVNQLNKNPGVIESAKVGQNQPNIVRFVLQITPNAQVLVTPDSQRLRVSISTTQSPDLIENLYRAETNQTKNKIWDQDHYIIVIDAGHGGKDPGATGPRGTKEKNITLAIAKKLQREINKEKNMKAVLTRSNDSYIKLFDRVKKARKLKPTIFISIHADAAKNRKASGSSVFILPLKGEKVSSRYAERVSLKENEVDLLYDPDIEKRDPVVQNTLADLVQQQTARLSQQLGTRVLHHLGKVNNLHKKKVEKANFAVLKAIDVCSILVETAFLSNRTEEKELRTSAYQEKLATAILFGIKDFLKTTPPEHLGVKISKH